MRTSHDLHATIRSVAEILSRLRARAPRVHCITNSVAQNFTANVLLAAGALPSMTISPEEIGHFAGSAGALLVNLGTFDRERGEAIDIAIDAAVKARRPWVLDPVLVDRSPPRAALACYLLSRRPAALRLNAAEFMTLAGADAERDRVSSFAGETQTVVALSGKTDIVAAGSNIAVIANGDPLMAKITAMGCAASALVAACLVVESDPWLASLAGLLILGIAGEIAAEGARGPGSLAVSILDTLYRLDPTAVIARAKVSS